MPHKVFVNGLTDEQVARDLQSMGAFIRESGVPIFDSPNVAGYAAQSLRDQYQGRYLVTTEEVAEPEKTPNDYVLTVEVTTQRTYVVTAESRDDALGALMDRVSGRREWPGKHHVTCLSSEDLLPVEVKSIRETNTPESVWADEWRRADVRDDTGAH